jgi:hypothetical protein
MTALTVILHCFNNAHAEKMAPFAHAAGCGAQLVRGDARVHALAAAAAAVCLGTKRAAAAWCGGLPQARRAASAVVPPLPAGRVRRPAPPGARRAGHALEPYGKFSQQGDHTGSHGWRGRSGAARHGTDSAPAPVRTNAVERSRLMPAISIQALGLRASVLARSHEGSSAVDRDDDASVA